MPAHDEFQVLDVSIPSRRFTTRFRRSPRLPHVTEKYKRGNLYNGQGIFLLI